MPLQIVLIVRKAKKTHKDLFIPPKIGHFDQIWQKNSTFCKNGPFLAKTRQTVLDDFSSLSNFTTKNNQKNDFLRFWFFGGPGFECLIPPIDVTVTVTVAVTMTLVALIPMTTMSVAEPVNAEESDFQGWGAARARADGQDGRRCCYTKIDFKLTNTIYEKNIIYLSLDI